jgi:hypothetical protein
MPDKTPKKKTTKFFLQETNSPNGYGRVIHRNDKGNGSQNQKEKGEGENETHQG